MNQITDDDATPFDLDEARADIARREKSKADARALWAYRAQELSLLYSAEMTDLEAHERKLVEHFRDLKLPESIRRELGECPGGC